MNIAYITVPLFLIIGGWLVWVCTPPWRENMYGQHVPATDRERREDRLGNVVMFVVGMTILAFVIYFDGSPMLAIVLFFLTLGIAWAVEKIWMKWKKRQRKPQIRKWIIEQLGYRTNPPQIRQKLGPPKYEASVTAGEPFSLPWDDGTQVRMMEQEPIMRRHPKYNGWWSAKDEREL